MPGTPVAAVKSALQRARARLELVWPKADQATEPAAPEARALIDQSIAAFETSDAAALERLLCHDATLEQPPSSTGFAGGAPVGRAVSALGSRGGCRRYALGAATNRWSDVAEALSISGISGRLEDKGPAGHGDSAPAGGMEHGAQAAWQKRQILRLDGHEEEGARGCLGASRFLGITRYIGDVLANPEGPLPFSGKAASKGEIAYARFAEKTPHIVVSRTLKDAAWKNTRIVRDVEEIRRMKERPGKDMYAVGGATLVCGLMNERLIDELRLVVHPVVLGGGKALFKGVKERRALTFLGAKPLEPGLVRLTYAT